LSVSGRGAFGAFVFAVGGIAFWVWGEITKQAR